MTELKKGMRLQSLENEEVIGTVTTVTKKNFALDVNGTETTYTLKDMDKAWQIYLDGTPAPDAQLQQDSKPEEQPQQNQNPEAQQGGEQLPQPQPQPEADPYTALKALYDGMTEACGKMPNVEWKLNPNGTTPCKVTGKGNFAEIRLQKKRMIVRVLQEVAADKGFKVKVIPESYGWTYKSEIDVQTTDKLEDLIALLEASRTEKVK